MQVMIITDIFGLSDSLLSYARQLAKAKMQVEVLDPYQGEKQHFADEKAAYHRFTRECGFDSYVDQISAALGKCSQEKVLLGFSVGAAAAYKALDTLSPGCEPLKAVNHLIGFYPGQIRHHLDITPICPVTLIFPQRELHFDLDPVINCLAEKDKLSYIRTPFNHGFMNPLSAHYHPGAAAYYYRQLTPVHMQLSPEALLNKLQPSPAGFE